MRQERGERVHYFGDGGSVGEAGDVWLSHIFEDDPDTERENEGGDYFGDGCFAYAHGDGSGQNAWLPYFWYGGIEEDEVGA